MINEKITIINRINITECEGKRREREGGKKKREKKVKLIPAIVDDVRYVGAFGVPFGLSRATGQERAKVGERRGGYERTDLLSV